MNILSSFVSHLIFLSAKYFHLELKSGDHVNHDILSLFDNIYPFQLSLKLDIGSIIAKVSLFFIILIHLTLDATNQ